MGGINDGTILVLKSDILRWVFMTLFDSFGKSWLYFILVQLSKLDPNKHIEPSEDKQFISTSPILIPFILS